MLSSTAEIPASISSSTLDSQGTGVGIILKTGMPLPEAADRASVAKPWFTRATAGLFLTSQDIASYTRYLVQEPQSP